MYLEKFIIKNFRCISNVSILFNKGLNILIGENNAGKSAILDALRLCLGHGNIKRDTYLTIDDFYIDTRTIQNRKRNIEFHLFFKIENEDEWACFTELRAINAEEYRDLQIHFQYYLDDKDKIKWKIWGGNQHDGGNNISSDTWTLIYYTYLGALRDAEHTLRPIRGNKLGQLYSKIQIKNTETEDKAYKDKLAHVLRNTLKEDDDWQSLIEKGKEKVNEHLKNTCFTGKELEVDIDFLPFEFNKIIENLRIQIPIYSNELIGDETNTQKYFEIYQNGLGYNNLIYIATVLGDLKQIQETDKESYVTLLIEEPEAHLHPQLQSVFFNYLKQIELRLNFQIFISSHSPTVTAKAELDSLIVIQNQASKVTAFPMQSSTLSNQNKKYLEKFLDVTKAQLLFSNGVILVEGISEALLLPIFSKMIIGNYDIDKYGVELVNINGVAFEHFAKLFNSDDETKRLNCRCAILTDDDRDKVSEEYSSRAINAQGYEMGNLKVLLAERTFEFELFKAGDNKTILLELFSQLHARAAANIIVSENLNEYAQNFVDKVNSNNAKSELAHTLAIKLESDMTIKQNFVVPNYIENAIKYVISGV